MPHPRLVSSAQNPLIKSVSTLRQAKHRRKSDQILIDGERAILQALSAGWRFSSVISCQDRAGSGERESFAEALENSDLTFDWIEVPGDVLKKVSYGQSVHPVAVAFPPMRTLESIENVDSERSVILVLDKVEKPGNIGAVLRSANALGVNAVLLSEPVCDMWNPNAIRASAGAIFETPMVSDSSVAVFDWLIGKQFSIFAARIEDSVDYRTVQWPTRVAIVLGSEAWGLGGRWRDACVQNIRVPMSGLVDSLNVSVAAAILGAAATSH